MKIISSLQFNSHITHAYISGVVWWLNVYFEANTDECYCQRYNIKNIKQLLLHTLIVPISFWWPIDDIGIERFLLGSINFI